MMKKYLLASAVIAGFALAGSAEAANISIDLSVNGSGVASATDGVTPGAATLFYNTAPLNLTLQSGITAGAPGFNASISGNIVPGSATPITVVARWTQINVPTASIGIANVLTALGASITTNGVLGASFISSIHVQAYADATNAAFGMGTLIADKTYTSGTGNATNDPIVSPFTATGATFSETVVATYTFVASPAANNSFSSNVQFIGVPEPATLALLGAGLLGLAAVRRRKA